MLPLLTVHIYQSMTPKPLTKRCTFFSVALVSVSLWSNNMFLNYLKCQSSCLLVKLLLWCRILKKDGLNHLDSSLLYYILVKFQGTTYPKLDLPELDSKYSEVVLLDPDLWKNFLSSLLPSLEEQLVVVCRPLSVTIFCAKSGKLLLWVESDAVQ